MKILHVADLHLTSNSEDRSYGLEVLREIRDLALSQKIDVLLFAGDIFDSFPDLQALKSDFLAILEPLVNQSSIFFLPGNHEDLHRGNLSLDKLDFAFVKVLSQTPFSLTTLDELEIIGIPYQKNYGDFLAWPPIPRTKKYRILTAHGAVEGTTFMGFNKEEGDDSVIDAALFSHFSPDAVALGHIHSGRILGSPVLAYPGSSRVWRRGEEGPRQVLLWDTASIGTPLQITLSKAGQYRRIEVPLSLNGDPMKEPLWGEFSSQDWVEIVFTGLVEDENVLTRLKDQWESQFAGRFRRMKISSEIQVLGNISSQNITIRFLDKWKSLEPETSASDDLKSIWLAARDAGLVQINKAIGTLKV